ncbi:Zn(II)2Cys6 transcription factor [Sporobolomyces koalae]|uniref:Zn(II)2Cys6 transcription factor n=1 Tax=Sporobolomyces koalae TaxID=500713 RepID=UPI00317292F4
MDNQSYGYSYSEGQACPPYPPPPPHRPRLSPDPTLRTPISPTRGVTQPLPPSHQSLGNSLQNSSKSSPLLSDSRPNDLARESCASLTKPSRPPLATHATGSSSKRQASSETSDGDRARAHSGVEMDGTDLTGKAKRTRNRKPASCAQCRKKKLRCNRADPCDQCTSRGQKEDCSWDGAQPLYSRRNETDTQDLRDQVARLESLVQYLTSQRHQEEGSQHTPETAASPGVVSFPSRSGRDEVSSATSEARARPRKPTHAMDLRANDLCEGIAQLAVKEFVVLEGSGNDSSAPWAPGNQKGLQFIDEARLFLKTMPQQFGVASAPAFSTNPSTASSPSLGVHSRLPSEAHLSVGDSPRSPPESVSSQPDPAALGTAALAGTPPSLSDVLKYLPTREQAHSAYQYWMGYVSWYAHPIHLSTFEEQWRSLDAALRIPDEDARNKAIDPFFIATFLGIIATGLSMMPPKRAQRDGFPENKDRVVDHWLEGSMLALTCGRFLDNPSVEAVRATIIVSTFFVFIATGERVGAGMGLLSLVVQNALSLGLHRDPDRTPGRYTFLEAEERRRLFWNLFMLCILSSVSLSRTWAVFDLNNVDTKLPLDCHDHEILDEAAARAGLEKRKIKFEETPMTSLLVRMKLAVFARKMNDRAFGINPVAYEEILALDAELNEFSEGIPSRYKLRFDPSGALLRPTTHVTVTEMRACMIMVSLTGEYIRLHRPWLLLSGNDKTFQYSRDQAVKYSKILLAVYRSPSCNRQKWGGLTYKATNAAIVLAIDMLAFPDQAEVDHLRSIVSAVQKQMEAQASSSTLCRKGSRLLKFLLDKEALLAAEREQSRQTKRVKVDNFLPSAHFDPRSLRSVFDASKVDKTIFVNEQEDDNDIYDHQKGSLSPLGSDEYSAITPASSASSHRPIANPRLRRPPSPPLPQVYATPQQETSAPSSTHPHQDVNFADIAGTFEFDFNLPYDRAGPQSFDLYDYPPSFPSPALTNDCYPSEAYAREPSRQPFTYKLGELDKPGSMSAYQLGAHSARNPTQCIAPKFARP